MSFSRGKHFQTFTVFGASLALLSHSDIILGGPVKELKLAFFKYIPWLCILLCF